MTVKTPIKATFTGSDVTGLAEFQSADFIGVIDGGTGAVTLTSNSILLGNGTNAIQSSPIQISGSTISVSDSTTITIDEGLSVTGTITSGNLLPPTDNTGAVGTNDLTWNNGRFTDLTIDDVLTVRTAIDLADGDRLRLGTNDDWQIYHDGTSNRMDLFTRDLTIRDDNTTRFTFGRTTGDFTATGNVTGGNILGNGASLSGINAFGNIAVAGESTVSADNTSDTLTFAEGSGISITTDAANNVITIGSVATDSIFATGGDMGTVEEAVTVSEDLGLITDAATVEYDLGLIVTSGVIQPDSLILPTKTVAQLANLAAAPAAQFVYCSDESGGAVPAFSDGTNWRRVTDRAIVT